MRELHILSGGAAHGLVRALQPAFEAANGCRIAGTFGAVGMMKEKLLSGAACDLLILTDALVRDLAAQGHVVADSARALGVVKTGLARKDGAAEADASTPDTLRWLLEQAGEIYFPDPAKATAGIHFMKVLQGLGVAEALAGRLRTFPNGAAAMAALAGSADATAVGCTQVTEILSAPGVRLSGLLPAPYELATVYTAAVCEDAQQAELAAQFAAALAGDAAAAARRKAGFE